VKLDPFIEAEKVAGRNVAKACGLLEVSKSAYYQRRNGAPSKRDATDVELLEQITAIFKESDGTYGSPRMHKELLHRHVACGRRRVTRLMRAAGLEGRCKKRWRKTTVPDPAAELARDLIQRHFGPSEEMDRRYVGDITYIATWEGWSYLATVIDLASRRVVGWALADHMRTELVEDALKMAFDHRAPQEGVIFHSDRGSQGGFNWTSQHLDHGGVHGTTVRMDSHDRRSPGGAQEEPTEGHPHLSRPDPLPGRADDRLAGRSGSVLGSDRSRGENRRRRHRGGRLIPRRV
jgi:hypothetical protein